MTVATNERDLSKFAVAIQQLEQGRSNAVVTVTLTANSSTTVATAPNCGEGSQPIPIARTLHAAQEIGNGTLYVSDVANGSFTITHANNAQTDRTFGFVCLG
ncbi:MAG TPA: hypothetical protein DEA80_14475 [Afipia sp.]|mgnify:CR=1 FL=1|nr:hypothetical protein [Afipia sp.]OUX62358.1 MAG: hypothetical protein CBB64_04425 [Afipia sp. TMED4]HAQ93410.1 hypothetical protein [Afipia sp.]HBF53302.1 hypothetical protein [Afipia sp.]HBR46106.1 hypothetical protein [Afipia sp.]